ncbi:hypothetical protein [Dickeya dianthicola]|nr:hypothetical protein [Dickeya dianthicola]ATO33571.1 hypothetical protein DDI_2403 [Dickeya dianthicola RNS04.9]MCA7001987.1 hypothetical protein [Dickeya dianthicola]MCI4001502.1 hypothetical protein [Dickeya dianthicola]MCI4117011.1 hypothetical protein [Dickeya dianthicola]MCI4120643.1 hypothetical protein [Dickeya dianthicola]
MYSENTRSKKTENSHTPENIENMSSDIAGLNDLKHQCSYQYVVGAQC